MFVVWDIDLDALNSKYAMELSFICIYKKVASRNSEDHEELDAVYAPRPVFFDLADLPPDKPAVLFASPETVRAAGGSFDGCKLGDLIYENAQAAVVTSRTPGRNSIIGPLQVVRLIRD